MNEKVENFRIKFRRSVNVYSSLIRINEKFQLVYNFTKITVTKGVGRKFSRGEQRKKIPKKSKKGRKIALLSFYLLYLYHV